MTMKCTALLKCRSGMTPEAFRHYYENRHAPLIRSLLPGIRDYRRNYLQDEGAFIYPGATRPDFDVITEMWFDDAAAYQHFLAVAAQEHVAQQIAQDEENVFDRAMTRMFVVEERSSMLPSPTEAAMTALIDERAIRDRLAQFAKVLDRKDWDALAEVFADDIVFDYGYGKDEHGMAALRQNMARHLDGCGPTQHLIGSISVTVDAQDATSCAYVQARHQRTDDRNGPVFDANGEYRDVWQRRAQGWRIVRRDAAWHMHSGDPAILGPGTAGSD
ncbi:EthD family reductase [Croceicoccus sp. F390]|uniref:EthD family reductase n=1 Tax=Croceicoccus esteveae TaxID=3075597 RepID=A0ABU2ZL05_9SPHN|nr:EthD family reductase [Croceicoccus sp. F390]MDT0577065.1 EthD family reductase [Croceicoccus sp. F390]